MDQAWPTYRDLLNAFHQCRKQKHPSYHQLTFEKRLGFHLAQLETEIHAGTYQPAPSSCFIVHRPKPREIFASHFRDRVVHHLVVSRLEALFEPSFCFESFACRKGKGTSGALRALQKSGRRLSQGGHRPLWILKLDLARFFVTIDRERLTRLLLAKINHPMLRQLTEKLFTHDGRLGCRRIGSIEELAEIQASKSWFTQPAHLGLPIGNLTSQFGANFYLNGLDHFVLRKLKPKAYLRYMDDLVFLDTSPERLAYLETEIELWLSRERGQHLNPSKTILKPLKTGVEYLGYWVRQTESSANPVQFFLPPKKKWELTQKVRTIEQHGLVPPYFAHPLALHPRTEPTRKQLSSLNSALGYAAHARSWRQRRSLLQRALRSPRLEGRITEGRTPNGSLNPTS